MTALPESFEWAVLVPELTCSDIAASRTFYIDVLGFDQCYEREGFAYLSMGKVQLMLEQAPGDWAVAPLERPFGRGVSLQIEVEAVQPILDGLASHAHGLFIDVRENWYQADDIEHGQREFIVQDPDGYLLRFCEVLGERSPA